MEEIKAPETDVPAKKPSTRTRTPRKPAAVSVEPNETDVQPNAQPSSVAAEVISEVNANAVTPVAVMGEMPVSASVEPEMNREIISLAELSDEEAEKQEKAKKNKKVKRHHLCKLVKKEYLEKHLNDYARLVTDAMYICKKCGRASNDATLLCKPVALESLKK